MCIVHCCDDLYLMDLTSRCVAMICTLQTTKMYTMWWSVSYGPQQQMQSIATKTQWAPPLKMHERQRSSQKCISKNKIQIDRIQMHTRHRYALLFWWCVSCASLSVQMPQTQMHRIQMHTPHRCIKHVCLVRLCLYKCIRHRELIAKVHTRWYIRHTFIRYRCTHNTDTHHMWWISVLRITV